MKYSPCVTCEVKGCSAMCPKWKAWFSEEWNKIRRAAAKNAGTVSVVHCAECDNWHPENKVGRATFGNEAAPCDEWSDYEDGITRYTRPTDFCSYGERREDATD